MSQNSPKVTSPLIDREDREGSASNEAATNGVVVEIPEIMASEAVSLTSGRNSRPGWAMRYHDIVPGKNAASNVETFDELMNVANAWLEKNTDVCVAWCEVICWTGTDKEVLTDTEYMIITLRFKDGIDNYNIRGLRLWLVPAKTGEEREQLKHKFFVPESKEETFDSLVKKLNQALDDGTINGRVLRVQTEQVLWDEDRGTVDANNTSFVVKIEKSVKVPVADIFTVFYTDKEEAPKSIVQKDFVPKETVDGYESFDVLVNSCNSWLKDQSDSGIVSLESLICITSRLAEGHPESTPCYSSVALIGDGRKETLRILRVFLAMDKASAASITYKSSLRGIASESFQPKLITARDSGSTKERGERMAETFHRLAIFAAAVDVVGIESYFNYVSVTESENTVDPDLTMKALVTLRLFITEESAHQYQKNLSRTASLRKQGSFRGKAVSKRGKQNKDGVDPENEHPGPIFLRNVVNRRFKYRWILVAVVAIIMMSLIVVLSVVYNNM